MGKYVVLQILEQVFPSNRARNMCQPRWIAAIYQFGVENPCILLPSISFIFLHLENRIDLKIVSDKSKDMVDRFPMGWLDAVMFFFSRKLTFQNFKRRCWYGWIKP